MGSCVILEAEYFGVDNVLAEVKSMAASHLLPDDAEKHTAEGFDEWNSDGLDLRDLVRTGILPAACYPGDAYPRVLQLLPAQRGAVVTFFRCGEDDLDSVEDFAQR